MTVPPVQINLKKKLGKAQHGKPPVTLILKGVLKATLTNLKQKHDKPIRILTVSPGENKKNQRILTPRKTKMTSWKTQPCPIKN